MTVAFLYTVFFFRVLHTIMELCPCQPKELKCGELRFKAADAIAVVALLDQNPEEAAGILIGVGRHETGFQTEMQDRGGPARSFWQLELPKAERAAVMANAYLAATKALARARTCRGNYLGYAGGTCVVGTRAAKTMKSAASLRSNVYRATVLFKQQN